MDRHHGHNWAKYAILICALFFALGILASYLTLVFVTSHGGQSTSPPELNITSVATAFNLVGNRYFNHLGYTVIGNAAFGNLPNYGSGKISGFNAIDIVGDVSLSGTITAFIFQNSTLPSMEFQNNSIISSAYAYESSSVVSSPANMTYDGVPIRIYQVTTVLAPSNSSSSSTLTYSQYGIAFRYRNVIFLCYDNSDTLCYNASTNLINLLSG